MEESVITNRNIYFNKQKPFFYPLFYVLMGVYNKNDNTHTQHSMFSSLQHNKLTVSETLSFSIVHTTAVLSDDADTKCSGNEFFLLSANQSKS